MIVANKGATREVKLCVSALIEQQRNAISQYCIEEKKLDEIADEMGTTKDALQGLIYRGRQALRAMMGSSSIWLSKKS